MEPLFSNAPAPGRIKPIPRKELLPLDVPQPAADAAPAQTEAPAPAPQPKPTPAPTPATTPAPVPTPTPATQGTPNTTKKNFKLKNAALTRTKTTETEGQNKENKENKEENSEKPVAELPLVSNIPEEIPSARQVNQVKLMPADKVFDRELMLRIWRLQRSEVHASVSGLGTGERPAERVPERRQNPRSTPNTEIRRPTRRDPGNVLKQGENAYRVTEPTSRLEELGRRVRALLNKICPDNLKTIVETLASIELQKAEELEYVIKIIFGKALVEPHYCETYADMVFALRTRYPEFPAENEGEKPHSFTRVLLNTVQNEFESLPTTFEPTDDDKAKFPNPEDLQIEMKKRKGKMLANMKFIGNLFLRQLLAVKVIGQVVHDLVGIKEGNALPEEHMIECVCELLQAIGFTLDETTQGESLMNSFASRLKDISSIRVGGKAAFGKRIQFSIEYLLDLRKNKWQKKLFKEQAKTKAAVRDEFDREARQHGRGNAPDSMFSVQTVGVRPAYIDDIANQKKRTKTDTGPQKVKFDQAYVKKICQYFGEEKDGESLQTDWAKAQPSDKETKQGVEWLLETGFDDDKKADIVAVTLAELMKRRLVPWDTLKECFSASLSGLPELKMDAPHCDVMVHCLVARLLMLENFNQVVLKPIQTFVSHNENRDLGWSLLLGIIKKLKTEKANDIVKKALSISEFASCAATARNTTVSDAKKLL